MEYTDEESRILTVKPIQKTADCNFEVVRTQWSFNGIKEEICHHCIHCTHVK